MLAPKVSPLILGPALLLLSFSSLAQTIHIAVASNFLKPAKALIKKFEEKTSSKVSLSSGSTGKIYAQIINGAPYDIFLAADTHRPTLLEKSGYALKGSRFTYAKGVLALWSLKEKDTRASLIKNKSYLAMANPKLAPYGKASQQVLENLELWEKSKKNIVLGENISQTFNFVYSGAAPMGFVAYSQVLNRGGNYWLVPEKMHASLEQQAVQLKNSKIAAEFLEFLKTESSKGFIKSAGYRVQ